MPTAATRASVLALLLVLGAVGRASGFEFFDGRLQVHGFYESQIRAIARDFDTADGVDLTQWWNILNLEIEGDLAPNGVGPVEVLQGYLRFEVRYDCVWKRSCGIFSSADVFGDRAERVPKRLGDGRRAGYRSSGTVFNDDERAFRSIPRHLLGFEFSRINPADPTAPVNSFSFPARPDGSLSPSQIFTIEGLDTLFDTIGEDQIFGTADDAAPFYFSDQLGCEFNYRKTNGSSNGIGTQILGPWNPGCKIRPIGVLANKPDPLSEIDGQAERNGIPGSTGFGALPLRPRPLNQATDTLTGALLPRASESEAQGVYLPNARLAQLIDGGELNAYDQNFREAELAWNRGGSQQDEKELKEAYLDVEMFDNRLWLRLGKQQIVWGKTELFRNQDQWNPQDLALASLPSLEESRIALWAARGVWSFYGVGPFEDVRLELAMLYDQFEPVDLGRCGEPYAPNPVCNKTLGLFIHGLTGFGLAGERRPPDPWNDASGIEVGARLEWRWDRFSFALTEYYGYTDFPFPETTFLYSRNVDPETGRPRRDMASGDCGDNVFGGTSGIPGAPTGDPDCLTAEVALANHSVNQQVFHLICSTSIGLNSLDVRACGQTIFNSNTDVLSNTPQDPTMFPVISALVGNLLVGNTTARLIAGSPLLGGPAFPPNLVSLNQDPCDGLLADCATVATGAGQINQPNALFAAGGLTINGLLTSEQKALLGCGEFYGTNCETQGFDLMNAEASVLMQSFPGIEGSFGVFDLLWDPSDAGVAQPGTLDFDGGPVGTRGDLILPGARGANLLADPLDDDPGYDPQKDGCSGDDGSADCAGTTTLLHPLTGQAFKSEMAALSWNFLMTLVAFSLPVDANNDNIPDNITIVDYDANNPLRLDGCSLLRPNLCGNVQSFFQITGIERNTVRAGGRNGLGRRDFTWHGGKELVLDYEKRNILGFSTDFAEDVTKSNWSVEFTWQDDLSFADNDQLSGITSGVDTYNMTISVDRPTFINFLNAGRTFFINTQWFVQYVDGYKSGFTSNGPWNVLGVLAVQTGYFDDRLLPQLTMVYDVRSNSGGFIPQVAYRFTANFSATFGLALFAGREEPRNMAISPSSLGNRVGSHAYEDFVENGLSAIRDRDEAFMRIRYSF